VTVVDAGVVVAALIQDDSLGELARQHLLEATAAPELLDVEVGSVVRRLALAGRVDAERGRAAMLDLADLPLQRAPHRALLARCWELRDALSFYDSAYVALAELLDVPLVTTDARLSRAAPRRCDVVVIR
jgi:predicted nucleic acid-binding protein